MKIVLKDLEKIIYALTLADRPNKRLKWLSRGFAVFNAKPGSLLSYWKKRLSKKDTKDMAMYSEIFKKFKEVDRLKNENAKEKKQRELTLRKMAASAASSIGKWITSGLAVASDSEVERRRNICLNCPYWDSLALKGTGRCKKCGCSTWAKIKLASESCPVGSW